jgi:catechol 2,3-dioxygenase-like lactoylglutathione lyase family enzyme
MIDHVSLGTRKFEDATAFYSACFAALGYRLEHKTHSEAAFGIDEKCEFWLYPVTSDEVVVGQRSHVAVTADTRERYGNFSTLPFGQARLKYVRLASVPTPALIISAL